MRQMFIRPSILHDGVAGAVVLALASTCRAEAVETRSISKPRAKCRLAYVNIHTAAHPAGEMRDQLPKSP